MTEKCLAELRRAILTKKSPESISLTVETLAPLLPLLATSKKPTPSQIKSLNELLSRSMLALYKLYPMPALKLAASIFTEVFKLRISPLVKLESNTETNKAIMLWEAVLSNVLYGMQSYIDFEHADLISLGTATYKPLIGILASPPLPKMSARLRVQAYMMLSDAAEGCSENRNILKDKKVLGGSRLGGMIVATNEFLVLDALFQLLARLTPSASDPEGRAALAAEVFQNSKAKTAFGKEVCERLACKFRNAKGREWDKAIEYIVAEMAKTDLHRTQPFRVIGNVQANSVVYSQNPPLDYVYVDSNGFVFNVQDGENIDSLEIDYMSVMSIHIVQSSEKTPNAVVHIKVSLSSPPMKGSDPVSSSDSRGDYFSFDIDPNDYDKLKLALKARSMGEYMQQNSSQGRTKRSMGTLDFNNITITSKSISEKAEIVQHLYVNSSPNPRVVEDTSATNNPDDVVELPLEPKHEPLIGNPTTPDNPKNLKVKEVTACPKKDPEISVSLPNAKAKKPRPKPLAKPTKKTLLDDGDEARTDLGLLESTFPSRAVSKTDKLTADLNVQRQGLSEPSTKDVDAQKNASISLPKPQSSPKAVKSHKRKRVIESSDEEADDQDGKTRNQTELPYNSQLLLQSDTATTRSSIKYRARAKKALNSLPAIDFDTIPAAASVASSPPMLVGKSTTKRQRKEAKTALEENRTTNESKKPKHEKKIIDNPVEESIAIRKTQRTSTKPRLDAVKEKDEVKPAIKIVDTVRTKASALIATNEKPKKSKKSPWKDLDYFVLSDDLAPGTSNMPSKVPMVPLEKPAVLKPNTPPSPFNDGSERAEAHHIPHHDQGQDTKGLPCSIAPRNPEPPDLDLVIGYTGNLDMDANFDLDPVVSVGDIFDAPLPVSVADVSSDREIPGGEMEPAVESIEAEDNQPLSTERTKAETSITHDDVSVIDTDKAQEPSRDVIMIDLTCVDEESGQEERAAIRHKEEPSPIVKGSLTKSTLKRSRVSFAHDTKPPSIIKKPASSVKTTPSSSSGKAAIVSMIPRLAMRSDASIFLKEDRFIKRQLRSQNTKIFRKHQRTSTPVVETDSEDEDRMMNSDEKIVAVLNKIQEVIVHRMNTKFDVPRMQAHIARERLLESSAEDLDVMLKECFHHSEKLVRLEVEYAEHGREAKRGLEDLNRMNEDIDRRLRQIISEHDRHSLSKKMSKVLVAPPQIFCS